MIEEIVYFGIKDEKVVNERAKDILALFDSCKSKYPNAEFIVSGQKPFVEIFIIGTRKVGSKYELETWKHVPVFRMAKHRFSENHPTHPNFWMMDMRINFDDSISSEDWKMDEADLKAKMIRALKHAVEDFIEPENKKYEKV